MNLLYLYPVGQKCGCSETPNLQPESEVRAVCWRTMSLTGRFALILDGNQIPYDYTVEVRNRFKGLDLIESLMNYGRRFVTLYRRQGSRPSPRKRNVKRQNGCLRRPYK